MNQPDPRLAPVLTAARALRPIDEREATSLRRLEEEVARLDAPFDEHADPVHLTASGFIVGSRGTVLHRHRTLGIWVQPGGHVDEGEAPEDAAARESVEETGLLVAQPPGGPLLLHVDCHLGPRDHIHLDLRYVLLGAGIPAPPPDESQEVEWLSFLEARRRCEPALAPALSLLEERWRSEEESWRAIVEKMGDPQEAT